MRTEKACLLAVLVAVASLSVPTSARKDDAATGAAPRLRAVIVYEWGLSTGGTKVDLDAKRLESFVRYVKLDLRESEAMKRKIRSGYPIFRICADLKDEEVAAISKLVSESGLRDFQPLESDEKKRQAHLDECPPTLVVLWNDRTKVFHLPLSGTIRKNLPKARRQAYHGMRNLCDALRRLNEVYESKPCLSAVPVKGQKYESFVKERDRLTK